MASPKVRPIRLAVVQPVMSPLRRPVFELMAQNPSIGIRVFVLSEALPNRPGWNLKEKEVLDVEVVAARRQLVTGTTPGGREATDFRFYSSTLARSIHAWGADAVLFGGTALIAQLLPLKFINGMKFIVGVADTPVTAAQYPSWRRALRACLYRQADAYVPYGNAAVAYLQSIGVPENRIFHGKYAVDNNLYHCTSPQRPSSDDYLCQWITVGQLVPRKGFEQLIRAWAAQKPEFLQRNKLWIVGEGPEHARLKALIEHHDLEGEISLLGHMHPDQLVGLYQRARAFVFPTLMDHWGLVVNEAMASGLPILCSKYAGCYLDLIRPENGLIFDPLERNSFAKALAEFWNHRNEWLKMGAYSQEIISTYTLAATADAMLNATNAALMTYS